MVTLLRVEGGTPFIHDACGKPAVRVLRIGEDGELITADDFAHLDGRRIYPGDEMLCDSCGGGFSMIVGLFQKVF